MIHILGAGSMGCLWAAHLSHSNTVCFIARNEIAHSSKRFTLQSVNSPHTPHYQIPLVRNQEISTLKRPKNIQLLLVCTKSYDTLDALLTLKPKLSDSTIIVLFQNGLGSQYEVIEAFPNNPVVAAVSTEGANKKSETEIIHAGIGETQLGVLSACNHTHLKTCNQALCTTGLVVRQHPDIWQALWTKLIINCAINPFTAILNCPNGEVKNNDFFKQNWPTLKQELSNLLVIAGYPMSQIEIEKKVFSVMDSTRNNISSMLQDVRKQKPTEIDHMNGFAYRYLKQHAHAHQANKLLWESVNALGN